VLVDACIVKETATLALNSDEGEFQLLLKFYSRLYRDGLSQNNNLILDAVGMNPPPSRRLALTFFTLACRSIKQEITSQPTLIEAPRYSGRISCISLKVLSTWAMQLIGRLAAIKK
jgi:hypothetical protein